MHKPNFHFINDNVKNLRLLKKEIQKLKNKNKTTVMMVIFTKIPWKKSAIITATCPPEKTKNKEILSNMIMINGKVGTPKIIVGKPQK